MTYEHYLKQLKRMLATGSQQKITQNSRAYKNTQKDISSSN